MCGQSHASCHVYSLVGSPVLGNICISALMYGIHICY
jgi:hypothetical protein